MPLRNIITDSTAAKLSQHGEHATNEIYNVAATGMQAAINTKQLTTQAKNASSNKCRARRGPTSFEPFINRDTAATLNEGICSPCE